MERVTDDLDLAAAIDLLPHGFIALDLALNVFFASRGAHELFGYSGDDGLLGTSALDLLHPGDLDRVAQLFAQMGDDAGARLSSPSIARHVEMSVRVRHASGSWIAVGATGRLVSEQGPFFLSVRPNHVNRTVEDLLHGLALGLDTDQLVAIVCEMTTAQFPGQDAWIVSGLRTGAPDVRGAGDLAPDAIAAAVAATEPVTTVGDGGYWSVVVDDADGSRIGCLLVTNHRNGAAPSPYDVDILRRTSHVASLVLQRELADEALRLALSSDALTGAVNRGSFTDLVSGLGPNDLPVALIYVDVDGFKAVNDNFGHAAGDRVLRRTTERLRRAVRLDDVVARLGGDEFAVLCRRIDGRGAEELVERVRGVLEIGADDHSPHDPSSSVGMAWASSPDDLGGLVDRADSEMYEQKRRRRSAPAR